MHLEVRETIDDIKWDNVTVIGTDALSTTDLHRTVINLILVSFKLTSGMNGAMDTVVGILTEDTNNGTFLSEDVASTVNNLEGTEFVVVDTSNINSADMNVEDLDVRTSDATISTTIHKGTARGAGGGLADKVDWAVNGSRKGVEGD